MVCYNWNYEKLNFLQPLYYKKTYKLRNLDTKKMNITIWLENLTRKMKRYDFSLVKLIVFFFTLFLINSWNSFRNFILQFGMVLINNSNTNASNIKKSIL